MEDKRPTELTQNEWETTEASYLANIILDHMETNRLTMQVLDKACEFVEKAFYRDATLKRLT